MENKKEMKQEKNLKKIGTILFAIILIIIGISFVSAACTTWLGATLTNWNYINNKFKYINLYFI